MPDAPRLAHQRPAQMPDAPWFEASLHGLHFSTPLTRTRSAWQVPAETSLRFASFAWANPSVHPLWLLLVPEADHYVVAGVWDRSVEGPA